MPFHPSHFVFPPVRRFRRARRRRAWWMFEWGMANWAYVVAGAALAAASVAVFWQLDRFLLARGLDHALTQAASWASVGSLGAGASGSRSFAGLDASALGADGGHLSLGGVRVAVCPGNRGVVLATGACGPLDEDTVDNHDAHADPTYGGADSFFLLFRGPPDDVRSALSVYRYGSSLLTQAAAPVEWCGSADSTVFVAAGEDATKEAEADGACEGSEDRTYVVLRFRLGGG